MKYLSLTEENQNQTSLWTRGPVRVLIPVNDGFVFNLVQIAPLLQNFNATWRLKNQEINDRGNHFEDQFRTALKALGHEVIHQDIYHNSIKFGEIDAAICLGETLYLFECYSSSTPLDLEISKPDKLQRRIFGSPDNKSKDCLNDKVDQVFKLQKHLIIYQRLTNTIFLKLQQLCHLWFHHFKNGFGKNLLDFGSMKIHLGF